MMAEISDCISTRYPKVIIENERFITTSQEITNASTVYL